MTDSLPGCFHYEIDGWRPPWAYMIDMVERYDRERTTTEEDDWLRAHPVDWLMVVRYMRSRTENHIAVTRKYLKEITIIDPVTGGPSDEYLGAKGDADRLNAKRLRWMAGLDEQIQEAKYCLGYEEVPRDVRAELVDRLLRIRAALISPLLFNESFPLRTVEALIRMYADDGFNQEFDPRAYRPPSMQ